MAITVSELAARVSATGSHFFERSSMRFFGDRMSNYRVLGPITIVTPSGDRREVWELERKRAVNGGLTASAYFSTETYERAFIRSDKPADRFWDLQLHSEYAGITNQWGHDTFHWRVTLKLNRRTFATDYYSGMAHATDGEPTPPTLASVLRCLQLDCQSGQLAFEEFCSDYGYDIDSRKAETTWKACRKTHVRLERFLASDYESFLATDLDR